MAVYRRKNSKGETTSWQFHYYHEGKSIRRAGFKTHEEALVAMEQMKEGVLLLKSPGFQDFAGEYVAWQKTRIRTWGRDKIALEHLGQFFGNRRLDRIAGYDIETYKMWRLEAGIMKSTIDRELQVLRHLYNAAVDWDKVDKSPVRAKHFYGEPNAFLPHIFTFDEEQRLLAVMDSELRSFIVFLLYTGLRKNQALNLEWKHVDLIEERMMLPAELTKDKKSRRLPLVGMALDVLKTRPLADDYCFATLTASSLQWRYKQALKKAGLPGSIRLHDLRHTFITRLSEAGVPIDQIRRLAQLNSLPATQRYMHGDEEGLREALLNMEQKLNFR